jgi:DNA-binding NarL/FixJ family response regulator
LKYQLPKMKSASPIRIILADDHEIFRDGFKVMLKKQPAVQLVAEASNGEELVKLTHELKPDVVVTDIKMPRLDGVEAAKRLTHDLPQIGIIALSMFDEENLIVDMLEAGAKGYLLKNAHKDEIIEAINTVNMGQTYYCNDTSSKLAQMIARSNFKPSMKPAKPDFSEKEFAVIRFICQEMSNKEMAYHLNLSIRTIEGYRDRILEKIGAKNAAGIVVYAIKNNIYQVQ